MRRTIFQIFLEVSSLINTTNSINYSFTGVIGVENSGDHIHTFELRNYASLATIKFVYSSYFWLEFHSNICLFMAWNLYLLIFLKKMKNIIHSAIYQVYRFILPIVIFLFIGILIIYIYIYSRAGFVSVISSDLHITM